MIQSGPRRADWLQEKLLECLSSRETIKRTMIFIKIDLIYCIAALIDAEVLGPGGPLLSPFSYRSSVWRTVSVSVVPAV